jgi:hypothetical protein
MTQMCGLETRELQHTLQLTLITQRTIRMQGLKTRCGNFRTTSQSKEDCANQSMKERRRSVYSLFSLTKFISNGWTMSRDKTQSIKMSMGKHKINFDQEVLHPRELYMQLFLSDDKWKKCKN